MLIRRAAAIPLIGFAGLLFVVAFVGALGASLYYEYVGLKMIFSDGDVVGGVFVSGVVGMLAASVIWLLTLPGAALLALAERLWDGPTPPSDHDYHDGPSNDDPLPWGSYYVDTPSFAGATY